MIEAKIVAHSKNRFDTELITFEVNAPRIILAEINTHRMFSRNTSSSRAIPLKRVIQSIKETPFIPIAFQKHHTGMQGVDYLDPEKKYKFEDIYKTLNNTLSDTFKNENDEWDEDYEYISDILHNHVLPLLESSEDGLTLSEWWLKTRDLVIAAALMMYAMGTTKQLCNRLLEPWMYVKMLITTGTDGLENFFSLRCPKYSWQNKGEFRSWKALVKEAFDGGASRDWVDGLESMPLIIRLKNNESQAEIHIQALAEAMYDAYNKSEPKYLESGQWHIPYNNKIESRSFNEWRMTNLRTIDVPQRLVDRRTEKIKVQIATAMAARVSYTTIGDEKGLNYDKMIELHNKLIEERHDSPLEHCAQSMTEEEYRNHIKGPRWMNGAVSMFKEEALGWANNFKGFIPYRYIIENKK